MTTAKEAIKEIRNGRMVIVIDNDSRENEGDLIIAAEKATPQIINFMISQARGLVCVPMQRSDLMRLNLSQMVDKNTDKMGTAFTVSVDHELTTTGISAYERALTIRKLIDPHTGSNDLRTPGHVFPLEAKENGVLERAGHTEAAVDLARLAGLTPAGVICEIVRDDGKMARLPDLEVFAEKWHLKITSVQNLISYRRAYDYPITLSSTVNLPTAYGTFRLLAFHEPGEHEPHLVLIKGNIAGSNEPVLTRVHSECLTGDLFGSLRCDCGDQLHNALRLIEENQSGILIYLRQEGRGIGFLNKLKAYELQEEGFDTVDANLKLGFKPDLRYFHAAGAILKFLNITKINLLTNNPQKVSDLQECGIEVKRYAHEIMPNCENYKYLKTKKKRMGHLINF